MSSLVRRWGSAMRAAMPQQSLMPVGLPAGRRTPRGRSRWYPVHAPEGMERSTCEKLRRIIPANVLSDAFVLSKERWAKRSGAWRLETVPMYREYFFVETGDVRALNNALQKLSFHVDLVGARERACTPLADDTRAFFERIAGPQHVIHNSVGVIEDGELRVFEGPLVGQERRVVKVDRHKRRCWASVGEPGDDFLETLPLEVPCKS